MYIYTLPIIAEYTGRFLAVQFLYASSLYDAYVYNKTYTVTDIDNLIIIVGLIT